MLKVIPLKQVLESIAAHVDIETFVPPSLDHPAVNGVVSERDFWKREAPKIDRERIISIAATELNKALHYCDNPPQWGRYDEEVKRYQFDDEAKDEGIAVLEYAIKRPDFEMKYRINHINFCELNGLNPLEIPPGRMLGEAGGDKTKGRIAWLRLFDDKLGFQLAPMIKLLDDAQIKHGLSQGQEIRDEEQPHSPQSAQSAGGKANVANKAKRNHGMYRYYPTVA